MKIVNSMDDLCADDFNRVCKLNVDRKDILSEKLDLTASDLENVFFEFGGDLYIVYIGEHYVSVMNNDSAEINVPFEAIIIIL